MIHRPITKTGSTSESSSCTLHRKRPINALGIPVPREFLHLPTFLSTSEIPLYQHLPKYFLINKNNSLFHSQINLIWFAFSVNYLPPTTTTPCAQFPGLQTQFCDGTSTVYQKLGHLSSSHLWPTKHHVTRTTAMASSSLFFSSVPWHHIFIPIPNLFASKHSVIYLKVN